MKAFIGILAAVVALAAPLSVRADDSSRTHMETTRLQGAFVYIYSFLDVRENDFGPRILDQIDAQLIAGFKKGGAESKVLRFKESAEGRDYAEARTVPFRGSVRTTEHVPVNETVHSNLSDETAVGATYRLLVFPSNFVQSNAWQFFDIRFFLIDCATNKTVWQTTIKGRHLTWWKNDEGAEGRARKITDDVMGQLKAAGYL
jgi:hypothetical protein